MSDRLHRTNINLREDDVTWFRDKYGRGWTEEVRDVVHRYVSAKKAEAEMYNIKFSNAVKSITYEQYVSGLPQRKRHE